LQSNIKYNSESSPSIYKLPAISIWLGFLSGLFGFIAGIPSIIVGHMALRNMKDELHPNRTYKRMAIFGLCLGYIGTLLSIYVAKIIYEIFLI
jgi:predicted acyltransferase